jgi:hypothetical protein
LQIGLIRVASTAAASKQHVPRLDFGQLAIVTALGAHP